MEKKYKHIWVKWLDASSDSGWLPEEKVKNAPDCIVNTVGYLVEDQEKRLVIAQNISSFGNYLGIMYIPKKYIIKRQWLYRSGKRLKG